MTLPSLAEAPHRHQRLPHTDEAWRARTAAARLDAMERAAPRLRDALRNSGTVLATRTFDVATFPYPTRFAFGGACTVPVPYVWLHNRAVLLEYRDLEGQRRRLLANPSRPDGSRAAPYFRDLTGGVPKLMQGPLERSLSRQAPPLPIQLAAAGIDPSSIDLVTFDHLHVQDVRPLLGPGGLYPKAKLLVHAVELEAARHLHPQQRYWYVDGGLDGVSAEHLAPFEHDLLLGEGLALIRTPGHTEGNHSIVFALPDGLVSISENGVAAECYAPLESRIPGLRQHAAHTGEAVILNANTRERTLDQYTSMRLEAALAAFDGPFPRHFSSSELTTSPLAPLIRPTFTWGAIDHGVVADG